MAERKLLLGRYEFLGKKRGERYRDVIGHRTISKHEYYKRKRASEAFESEVRLGRKSTNEKARLEAYKRTWRNTFWENLKRGRMPGYSAADPTHPELPPRPKSQFDEHNLRYSEIERSERWKRIWKGLKPEEGKSRSKKYGPNSAYANSLELIGFRPRESWWNVGDTPQVQYGAEAGKEKYQVSEPIKPLERQEQAYTRYGEMPDRGERQWFAHAGPPVWYGRKYTTPSGQVYYQPSLFGQAQFLRQ